MTINDAGTIWGRAKSHLETGERMLDRLPGVAVLSYRSIGLGRDRWKWEFSVQIPPILLTCS